MCERESGRGRFQSGETGCRVWEGVIESRRYYLRRFFFFFIELNFQLGVFDILLFFASFTSKKKKKTNNNNNNNRLVLFVFTLY